MTNGINGTVKPVDSATKLSELGVRDVYSRGQHTGTPADLMNGSPGNLAGYTIFPMTSGFRNHSGMQDWKSLTAFEYSPTAYTDRNGHTWAAVRTSSRADAYDIGDLLQYGAVDNPDNSANRIKGWLEATEGFHAIEYAIRPELQLLITERHEHLADPILKKYVTDLGYFGPLNDLGKHLSKAETLRQDWNRFLASKEGRELAIQKGNIDSVEYLAVWPAEGVIYAVGRARNGKLVLYRGEKSHEILATEADIVAVTLEDRLKAALGEEAMHIARKSFDKVGTVQELIDEERATKAELLEFYESLAKGAESKPELKSLYGKIIRHLEYDIATIEQRYRHFAEQQFGSNGLVQKLAAEAYALGLETEKEVSDYIVAKIREASEGTEGKDKSADSTGVNANSESSGKEQESAPDSDAETAAQGSEGSPAQESSSESASSE